MTNSSLGPDFTWSNGPNQSGASELEFQNKAVQIARRASTVDIPGYWFLSSGIVYEFAGTNPDEFITRRHNGDSEWTQNKDGISSGAWGDRMYIPNPKSNGEYVISTAAQMIPGSSNYGYGIFFDAQIRDDGYTESGYIFQFDPGYGYGELIIRKWDDDHEESVPAYRYKDASLPDTNDPWWTQEHDVELKVTQGTNGNKNLAVYIDDELMFDDFSFQPNEGATYTGFRVWGTETEFEEMEIDSL